jgi:hypothetical protein
LTDEVSVWQYIVVKKDVDPMRDELIGSKSNQQIQQILNTEDAIPAALRHLGLPPESSESTNSSESPDSSSSPDSTISPESPDAFREELLS